MITLLNCSTDKDMQLKTGKFSPTLANLINQLTNESTDINQVKNTPLKSNKMQPMSNSDDNLSIVDELEREDNLVIEDLGFVSSIKNTFKWTYKTIKVNLLSATFHVSFILFLREISRKQSRL